MLSAKEQAEKNRIDRKIQTGKASRKDVLRALALLRKSRKVSA